MMLLFAISMVVTPIVIFGDGAQAQEIFSTALEPAHSRQFTTILHEMTASAFDHARSNRPAIGQVSRVIHELQVAFKIVGGLEELYAFANFGCVASERNSAMS